MKRILEYIGELILWLAILITIFFSISSSAQVLDTNCIIPIGPAFDNICQMSETNPDTLQSNTVYTQCFTYTPTDSCFTLSYLLINGSGCGPSAYGQLSFDVYNQSCDSLIAQGTIYPTPSGTWVCTGLGTFIICYTFRTKCLITEICPLINPSPLEVVWLETRALYSKEEKRIHIAWSTAQELNCSHYFIQKFDYNRFKDIGRLKCKEGTFINTYLYLDEVPQEYNYYRIKQVNYNNKYFYSDIFLVKVTDPDVPCCYFSIYGEPIDERNLKSGTYLKLCNGKYEKIIHIN